MQPFLIYLRLGFDHITDWGGYDHMLFVVALCAVYRLVHWRAVLTLVTAFTVGHSLTLALATQDVLSVPSAMVELLIPVTILISAVSNLLVPNAPAETEQPHRLPTVLRSHGFLYALVFGLIHGLGFSGYLRSLLGREADIIGSLLAFNLGLEVGQLLIVAAMLGISSAVVDRLRMPPPVWTRLVSGVVGSVAIWLIMNRL